MKGFVMPQRLDATQVGNHYQGNNKVLHIFSDGKPNGLADPTAILAAANSVGMESKFQPTA